MNRRAFLLGAAMVLLGNLVAVALRSYAEAKFLEAYGAAVLPWLLIANALGFAAATLGYDAISRRIAPRVLDLGLLAALGVAAATSPLTLSAGAPPVVLVVALAAVSQVAGLALWNRVCAAVVGRDARRMLPRAGAAVTAGGAIAGLGAGALAYRLGSDVLPYLGAAVTAAVIALAIAQERALAAGGAPGVTAPPGTPEGLTPANRRLLSAMIAVAALEAIVATIVDLQFVAALKGRYAGDTLAVAVSLFYGGTNLVLLLLQATAVPRLLVTRSLPTTAAIHPVLVIAGYVAFAAVPGFGVLAGTRTADQVMRLATSRTAQEVSLSAFPPGPRARWKVLLRGAIGPAGAGLAALVLLAIGPAALAQPVRLAGAAIGIAVVWFAAAQLSARRFQAALAAPLGIAARRRSDPRLIDLAALERWTHAAGADDPRTAALARAALAHARVDATDLADQIRHDEPAVRAALYDQLGRAPMPALRAELAAAVMIEDDDRALALGLKALALAGDDRVLERGRSRAALSREIADVMRAAEHTLRGGAATAAVIAELCERDPGWAAAIARARRAELTDEVLAATLAEAAEVPARRAGALAVIARGGPPAVLGTLAAALEAGAPEAIAAIAELDEAGARHLAAHAGSFGPLARLAMARALAGAPAAIPLLAALITDADRDVARAALRAALAVARGGGALPAEPIADAHRTALAALVAHLDARDAASGWSACARHELELATRGCAAHVLWAAAVETAVAGRDPAPLAAVARRLIAGREPDRRRALDVVQELQSGRAELLAVLERWLRPPVPNAGGSGPMPAAGSSGSGPTAAASPEPAPVPAPAPAASEPAAPQPRTPIQRKPTHRGASAEAVAALEPFDPWLAKLARGELERLEPSLVALRKAPLFATVSGPALAALAQRAKRQRVAGTVFAEAEVGHTLLVVEAGVLIARRAPDPDRRIEPGGVVGELAVLAKARRAATVITDKPATVLEIDREAFTATARRAPELLLGLSGTLAGWLASNRPDVL